MSQRTFFTTLLGSLIACGGINHVALAQPDPNEAAKAANPVNWQQANHAPMVPMVPLNLRIDKPDGTPLAQRQVEIYFSAPHMNRDSSTTTNAQGGVTMSNDFQLGTYSVYIHADGIGSGYLKSVNVQRAGGPLTELQLQQANGILRVTVKEAPTDIIQAEPARSVGGAQLFLQLFPGMSATDNLGNQINQGISVPVYTVTRDGDGSLEVPNLLPGRYRLAVHAVPGYASAAKEFIMTEGAAVSINMFLTPDVITSLRVTVRDAQDHPLPNADFKLLFSPVANEGLVRDSPDRALRIIHTDVKGEAILFPIKSGTWTIVAYYKLTIKRTEVTIPVTGGTISLIAQPN